MEQINLFEFILSETRASKRTDIQTHNSFRTYLDGLVEFDKLNHSYPIKRVSDYLDKLTERHYYALSKAMDYVWFTK
ncbi:MAG: hypothetical protein KKD48_04920 [Nanoarchaeota archaeon]|nr:hypothetical protein [Nanoarchaeota archaeon]